jgi:hypothetical protein
MGNVKKHEEKKRTESVVVEYNDSIKGSRGRLLCDAAGKH